MSRHSRPSKADRQAAIEAASMVSIPAIPNGEKLTVENAGGAVVIAVANFDHEIKVAPSDNLQRNDVVPFAFRTAFFNPN